MIPMTQPGNSLGQDSQLFEFYLFVNPLGRNCYHTEQALLQTISQMAGKAETHVLCYHNQQIVTDFMDQLELESKNINVRNQIFQLIYQASLAYKAATIQGKRRGRLFLMKLQQLIDQDVWQYNTQLARDIADAVGIDLDLFDEDIQAQRTKKLYLNDQKIANEMGIFQTPSLVIFEHCFGDCGYMLNGPVNQEDIRKQINRISRECGVQQSHDYQSLEPPQLNLLPKI